MVVLSPLDPMMDSFDVVVNMALLNLEDTLTNAFTS